MREAFSNVVLAVVELLEAEARNAKRHVFKLALALALVAVAAALFVGAGGFLVAAVYMALLRLLAPPLALLVCGAAALLVGGVVVWIAIRLGR